MEYTALAYACWNNSTSNSRTKTVDLLLKHGARVNIDNPLQICVDTLLTNWYTADVYLKGYVMATHLIDHGAVIDIAHPRGRSAVEFCLANTGLSTTDQFIKNTCRSIVRLVFNENTIKIPDGTVDFELEYNGTRDVFDLENIEICPYIYECGYRIKQIEDIIRSEEIKKHLSEESSNLLHVIQEVKAWNLQRLCRKAVRKALGSPLTKKVPELPLPEVLKNYLYVDLTFEEEE